MSKNKFRKLISIILTLALTATTIPCGAANIIPINGGHVAVPPSSPVTKTSTNSKNLDGGFSLQAMKSKIDDIFNPRKSKAALREYPSGKCGDSCSWSLNTETGELTISGTGAIDIYSWDVDSIKTVTIEHGITSIGERAFDGCSALTSITIPDSVEDIGDFVFPCCNLESINVDVGNSNYASVDGVLFDKEKTLIQYPAGKTNIFYEIPNFVTSIGESAFSGCSKLESAIIGDNVTSIEDWAFCECSSLTSITISNSVTSIKMGAFKGCNKLESAIIGNKVTSIGKSAFYMCSGLSQVFYFGTSDIENSEHVFEDCTSLTSVTVPKDYKNSFFCGKPASKCLTTGTCGNNVKWILNENTNALTIYGTGEITSGTWDKDSIKSAVIENGITSIGKEAFYSCNSLASVIIPNSVTSIGWDAFRSCSALTSVTIPDSVTSIGNSAFYGCSSLVSVNISNSVTTIEICTFKGCSALTSVTIPDSVTSIGDSAFYGCSSLTNITIPNSVTSIEDYAFYGCSKLETVSFPNKVRFIQKYAFSHCTALNNVTVAGDLNHVGEEAFSNCMALNKFTYKGTKAPNYDGDKVFYNCKKLDKISVPKNYEGDNFCGYPTDKPKILDTILTIATIGGFVLPMIGIPTVIGCLQKCGYCRCENDKAGKRVPSSDESAPLLNRKGPSIHDEDSDYSISEVPQVIVVPGDSSVVVGSPIIVRPSDHSSKEESRADDAVNSSDKVESSDVDEDDDSTVEEESLTGDDTNSTVGESLHPTERVA